MRAAVVIGLLVSAVLAGCTEEEEAPVQRRVIGADPERGQQIVREIGCGTCHAIPGVSGARGTVGPSLEGFAGRNLIGGVAANEPQILAKWVRDAPSIAPDTGMPSLPLTEEEARDVAAFLYTLR